MAKECAREEDLCRRRETCLTLLKGLGFTEPNSTEASAPEVAASARANRVSLASLGVELGSLARKALMPQLVHKLALAPQTDWQRAPPKLLTDTSAPATAPTVTQAHSEPLALLGPGEGQVAAPSRVEAPAPAEKRRRTSRSS